MQVISLHPPPGKKEMEKFFGATHTKKKRISRADELDHFPLQKKKSNSVTLILMSAPLSPSSHNLRK